VTVLGIILSVMNAGMIVGGILIGVWGGTRPRIHTVMVSLLVLGVGVAVFGMARSPYVLAGAMFITMMTPALANVPLMSMMQAKIPPDMQGRVFATIQQVAMIVSPLGVLLVGPLADNVFEPLVGQPAWAAFAPFFGDSVGAGMGLMTTFAGVGVFIASAIAYALPMIRHMEENIPDYVPEASEEPATIEAAQDTSNTGLAVAPAAD
jgi:MFS family permease